MYRQSIIIERRVKFKRLQDRYKIQAVTSMRENDRDIGQQKLRVDESNAES